MGLEIVGQKLAEHTRSTIAEKVEKSAHTLMTALDISNRLDLNPIQSLIFFHYLAASLTHVRYRTAREVARLAHTHYANPVRNLARDYITLLAEQSRLAEEEFTTKAAKAADALVQSFTTPNQDQTTRLLAHDAQSAPIQEALAHITQLQIQIQGSPDFLASAARRLATLSFRIHSENLPQGAEKLIRLVDTLATENRRLRTVASQEYTAYKHRLADSYAQLSTSPTP